MGDAILNRSNLRNLVKKAFSPVSLLRTIFVSALIVRLIYIAFLKEGFYFSDFKAYEGAALSLLQGQGFDPDYARPPLYPLFLAANYLVFGVHLFPIRIVQALLGAYSAVLIFFIADRVLGREAAAIAAWICVFYPYYVFIAGLLYPTMITTFFLISMIYFLILSVQRNSIIHLSVASICLGIASLAVPVCLAFLPLLVLWFLLYPNLKTGRRFIFSGLSVVIVALCLSPWVYICYNLYGRLILVDPRAERHMPYIHSDDAQAQGVNDGGGQRLSRILARPDKFFGSAGREFLRFWKFVPDRVVTRDRDYRQKFHEVDDRMVVDHPFTSPLMDWVSILTYGPVFFLALAGIVLCLDSWTLLSLPIFLLLSHALGYSLFFSQTRYRLPVEFCLMILAGGGGWAIWKLLRKEKQTG